MIVYLTGRGMDGGGQQAFFLLFANDKLLVSVKGKEH